MVEERRPEPEPVRLPIGRHAAPVHDQRRTRRRAGVDITGDLVPVYAADQRPHVAAGPAPVPRADPGHPLA